MYPSEFYLYAFFVVVIGIFILKIIIMSQRMRQEMGEPYSYQQILVDTGSFIVFFLCFTLIAVSEGFKLFHLPRPISDCICLGLLILNPAILIVWAKASVVNGPTTSKAYWKWFLEHKWPEIDARKREELARFKAERDSYYTNSDRVSKND